SFPTRRSSDLLALAQRADVLESTGDMLRSRVRFATLGEHIFVHSSYPTSSADAVFFGPDSYRFCSLIARSLGPCKRVVDVGCGTGAGGLIASSQAEQVVLTDVNQGALDLAQVNARLAGVSVQLQKSDVLAAVEGPIDAVIANPPYMRDEAGRAYRDGGGKLGEGLAVRIVREALARLQPGGRLVL